MNQSVKMRVFALVSLLLMFATAALATETSQHRHAGSGAEQQAQSGGQKGGCGCAGMKNMTREEHAAMHKAHMAMKPEDRKAMHEAMRAQAQKAAPESGKAQGTTWRWE